MEKAWILVGMMGSGKSSVGRRVAELSGREFRDTDFLLSHKIGRSIRQIFELYGESSFRDFETGLLRDLQPAPIVLATGGGIVVRDENWTELERIGMTVYLRASSDILQQRLTISKNKRPLLQSEDWEAKLASLLEGRVSQYEKAQFTVSVEGKDIEAVATEVFELMQEECP